MHPQCSTVDRPVASAGSWDDVAGWLSPSPPLLVDAPPAGPLLGSIAKSSAVLHNNGATAELLIRAERFALQYVASSLWPEERCAKCLRWVAPFKEWNVFRSEVRQRVGHKGLIVCGSRWLCPICAGTISEGRRVEVERAVKRWTERDGGVYLASLTVSHHAYTNVLALREALTRAYKRMCESWAYKHELVAELGLFGTVRALEVTFGVNGAHPHYHVLLFTRGPVDVDELQAGLFAQWSAAVASEGLKSEQPHGVKVQRTFGAVQGYLAKMGCLTEAEFEKRYGRPAGDNHWGPGRELTGWVQKRGRGEHDSPFDLMRRLLHHHDETAPLTSGEKKQKIKWLHQYKLAFAGQHQLVISKNLRLAVLGDLPKLRDEALARRIAPDSEWIGQFDRRLFALLVEKRDRRVAFETAVLAEGVDGAAGFLRALAAEAGLAGHLEVLGRGPAGRVYMDPEAHLGEFEEGMEWGRSAGPVVEGLTDDLPF